jgi:hypothetical protein
MRLPAITIRVTLRHAVAVGHELLEQFGGAMRRITFALLLIAFGLSAANAADSDDVTVVGGLDFGFKKLRLDFDGTDGAFSPSFVTINPNLGLSYDSFYASLSYDTSISAESTSGTDPIFGAGTKTDYSRTDSTFTLGYRLNQWFSLFAGYTYGVSKANVSGAFLVSTVRDIEFKEVGPFAGAAFSMTFGNIGTLGLSVGYAKLNGELSRVDHPSRSVDFQVEGDTEGFSYGLAWSGPLTGSLGYRVGLKSTRYETQDLRNLTERYTSLFLGISNYF